MDNGEIYGADRMDVDTETVVPEDINYQASIDIIRQKLINPQDTFICIGWHLKHIKQDKLYKQEQYKNIYEFAAGKFRMKKSKVSRFINLCEQFSVNNDSPMIAEEYKEFSMSQLEEMLSMDPEDRAKITPDMTIKQIREVKRQAKKRKKKERREEDAPEEIVAMSQQPEPEYPSHTIEEEQPKLPKFANDTERKAWLESIEKWGLWYEDPNIQARYYKYDFEDGSRLIAIKYRYTCPPYMWDQPEKYSEQIEADGSYYGTPAYHMIYSDEYWEEHQSEYRKKYKKYYTHDTVKITELVKFLKWLQGRNRSDITYLYIEFDTAHLELNKKASSVADRYMEFYAKHGYIPQLFKPNGSKGKDGRKIGKEIKDYMPAIITSCGSYDGTNTILIFNLWANIIEVMQNESFSMEEQENEIIKLLRIADPKEREKIEKEKKIDGRLIREAEKETGEIGKIRFKVSVPSVKSYYRLMGMDDDDVDKAKELGVSNTQLYKAAGNGIVTDCVSLIMQHIYKAQYDSSFVCTDEKMNAKQDAEKQEE